MRMELVESLYRISLSIGNSPRLDLTVNEALKAYYDNLGLMEAAILSPRDPDHHRLHIVGTYPLKNKPGSFIHKLLEFHNVSEEKSLTFPYRGTFGCGAYYAVQELKGYGFLVMVREEASLPLTLLQELVPLNMKLASACLSAMNNELLEREIRFRKAAEEALILSERRLDLALRVTDDGLWDWHIKEDEVYFSPTYYTMLGYQPYEFPPALENWKDLIHPDDLQPTMQKLDKCLEDHDESFEMEFRMASKNGEWIWILGRGSVVERDDSGRPTRMVGTHVNITKRKETEERMEKLNRELYIAASTDRITGLLNRQRFDDILMQEIERASRYENPLSILMFDVDNFKLINDSFGHQKGDSILASIASIIEENIRSTDFAARWGGDEFAVLVLADLENAVHLGNKLRGGLTKISLSSLGSLTISMGVAQFEQNDTIHTFVKRADDALYRAKAKGKNRVEY
jgi:diguanylate cyclase (GGDEF)-like protein/PAS domain S-box-containing protein